VVISIINAYTEDTILFPELNKSHRDLNLNYADQLGAFSYAFYQILKSTAKWRIDIALFGVDNP